MPPASPSIETILSSDDVSALLESISDGLFLNESADASLIGLCIESGAVKCLRAALANGVPCPRPSEMWRISTRLGELGDRESIIALDEAGIRFSGAAAGHAAAKLGDESTVELVASLGYRLTECRTHPYSNFALVRRLVSTFELAPTAEDVSQAVASGDVRLAGWIALAFYGLRSNFSNEKEAKIAIAELLKNSPPESEDARMIRAYLLSRLPNNEHAAHTKNICTGPAEDGDGPRTLVVRRAWSDTGATKLLQEGLPLDAKHVLGMTNVDLAMQFGDVKAADAYAKAGAPVSGWAEWPGIDPKGLTAAKHFIVKEKCYFPLLAQLTKSASQMKRAIRQHPALVDQRAVNGTTPLMYAWDMPIDVARAILERSRLNFATDRQGWNALHHAAYRAPYGFGTKDLFVALLEAGIDPTSRDSMGRTARDLLSLRWDNHEKTNTQQTCNVREVADLLGRAARARSISTALSSMTSKSSPVVAANARPNDVL